MSTSSKTNWDGYIALLLVGLLVWSAMGKGGSILSPPPVDFPAVLIIEETEDRTPELANILNGEELDSYLESKWSGDWRVLDKDATFTATDSKWSKAIEVAKSTEGFTTPWLLVSNGKSGWQGPLPTDDAQAVIDAIKPYEE